MSPVRRLLAVSRPEWPRLALAALLGAPRSGDLLALTPIFVSAALVFAVGVGAAGLLERRRATLRR